MQLPLAPKTPRPSQFTAVQILSLTMSHLITPSNVTARLSVIFSHALHFWHAPFARTASTLPIGRLPRGSSRLPGTYWCCLACELLLSAAWHSLVPFGLSAFPPEQCCSLARCPHLVSGTLPSRSAVSQPVHRDVFGHGIQSPTTAPLTRHLA